MDDTTATRLGRIADFDAGRRTTPVTRLLLAVGRTRGFARVYRVIGPVLDPWVLRRSRGRVASRVYGLPALLLTTVGRRSGQARVSPLLYLRDGQDFIVVGTNFGQEHHPGWTANLLARPDAEIEVGPERLAVTAELVDGAAWGQLWARFVDLYPGYANYLERAGRTPRMFRLRPVL
ncbi:MAG TPA: nitroreductase/quinone reductase family protein [Acidimicrobiales bacterium]|nr:nitroreductase/quinone reductase family protein [Acidimicrobiales bacterium]